LAEDRSCVQIRVDSCLGVIRDVCQRLVAENVSPRIIEQLQHLNEMLSLIDHHEVSESELTRIEGCTNQLMAELGLLFSHQGITALYDRTVH